MNVCATFHRYISRYLLVDDSGGLQTGQRCYTVHRAIAVHGQIFFNTAQPGKSTITRVEIKTGKKTPIGSRLLQQQVATRQRREGGGVGEREEARAGSLS